MKLRKRKSCPSCNKSISGLEKVIEGGLSNKTKDKELSDVWMGIGKTKHFSYLVCNHCGTLFNYEYPSDKLLNKLYGDMPANMEAEVSSDNQIKNQKSYSRKIFNALKKIKVEFKNFSFIEIGADRGFLIRELNKLLDKKFINCVGIEPNNVVKKDLQKNLSNASINYKLLDDIKHINLKDNGNYNLSACIHILDHCFEPLKMLKNIGKTLERNGILLIVVHNPQSSLAKLLGKKWPAYCSQHPQLFSKKGLKEISKLSGFEIINKGRTMNYFALSMITNFLGIKIGFADKINLKLPLGNMFYLLRKI